MATIRALKYNGGVPKTELKTENVEALKKGLVNLETHVENLKKFGLPVVAAINRFESDTDAEIAALHDCCERLQIPVSLTEVFAKGGEGGLDLAQKVTEIVDKDSADFRFLYDLDLSIKEKLEKIAREIYRADGVNFDGKAQKMLKEIDDMQLSHLPVCVAKTQYSLSDDPTKLGKPTGFKLNVRDLRISAGAGFIVALTGDIMTMPGLPKVPAAMNIDCFYDEKTGTGVITGLF